MEKLKSYLLSYKWVASLPLASKFNKILKYTAKVDDSAK
jgi:hypothetical protein